MTVHLWGEMPRGDWLLTVTTPDGTIGQYLKYYIIFEIIFLPKCLILLLNKVQVEEYSLVIHGTKEKPIDYERFVKPDPSNVSFLKRYTYYQSFFDNQQQQHNNINKHHSSSLLLSVFLNIIIVSSMLIFQTLYFLYLPTTHDSYFSCFQTQFLLFC